MHENLINSDDQLLAQELDERICSFDVRGRWIFLIGHRGIGKTSFLAECERASDSSKIKCFDLDQQLELKFGIDVFRFVAENESHFRQLERQTLLSTLRTYDGDGLTFVVSVGAGYQGIFPTRSERVWLRRRTDKSGRIFLNRPRLNAHVSPMQEYQERFVERESRYSQQATHQFVLREGVQRWSRLEVQVWDALLNGQNFEAGGYVSPLPFHLGIDLEDDRNSEALVDRQKLALSQILKLGPHRIEVRDDVFTPDQIVQLLKVIPKSKLLIAFRTNAGAAEQLWLQIAHTVYKNKIEFDDHIGSDKAIIDWPVEWGECPFARPAIVSLHGRFEDFANAKQTTLSFAEKLYPKCHLKIAVQTSSFFELQELHRWYEEFPKQRSILPMSSVGRWIWYRQRFSKDMKIQFWQTGLDSVADQPTLLEWLAAKVNSKSHWAAVLGNPVDHSWTPAIHQEFFARRDAFVTRVPIPLEEMNQDTLGFLYSLGLRWAAVTSPLKKRAYHLAAEKTKSSDQFESANTLYFRSLQNIFAHLTDDRGMEALIKSQWRNQSTVIWGGGGLSQLLRTLLPNARHIAARTGIVDPEHEQFENLVWAAPRNSLIKTPPKEWTFRRVIDLNYTENSLGREVALVRQCDYVSGDALFFEQALAQQEFWRTIES